LDARDAGSVAVRARAQMIAARA